MNIQPRYVFALIGLLIVLGYIWVGLGYPADAQQVTSRPANYVTLHAAPGNSVVQMFDELRDSPDVKITTFPDGWGCTKLSDRLAVGDGSTAMYFYKLDCGNRTGYVNVNWVR